MKTIRLPIRSDGRVFSSRSRGERARQSINDQLADPGVLEVVLDFADVLAVGHSYADELLGKLASRAANKGGPRLVVSGASTDVSSVLHDVVAKRGLERTIEFRA